ncbi:MAG: hypothetical protein JW850_11920 [Thermoflexales bacterium]|nr:hypothetical protein [Thermoflexales bacterium]
MALEQNSQEQVQVLVGRLRWVITLRWVAVIGVALSDQVTMLAGYSQSQGLLAWLPAPLVLVYNALFWLWLRRVEHSRSAPGQAIRQLGWQLYLQGLCDIAAMILLVYLNGGIEYPLFYAPLVAILLTGLLLSRRLVFLQANTAALLFVATVLAEQQAWIPHYPGLAPVYHHGLYRDFHAALGTALSMVGMLNVTAFLASSVGQRLRWAEKQSRDLLGQLRQQVGEAAAQLARSTDSLRDGAEQVSQVAEQIAVTVNEIAQGSSQQAAQLERLSHSLEDMATSSLRVAEGAQETHQAAGRATATAEQGQQAALAATERMEEIAQVFAQAEAAMGGLGRLSGQIAEMAAAIDHFAERTDLLALNAGIEAAHAGEHGRGFAVVAGEVKKLAASSAASAEQVARTVTQVQTEVGQVLQSIQAGAQRVKSGQEAITTLQDVLGGMAAVIAITDELAGTMEHLAGQQRQTHQELVRAAGEIATAAEQTASGSQQTAAAVEEQVASFGELAHAVQDMAALATHLDQTVAGLFKGNEP